MDVESASVTGRSGFGLMLEFLKKNRVKCQTILVEKTDRLYRNLKDYVTMDEAGVTGPLRQRKQRALSRCAIERSVHTRHQGADGPQLLPESRGGDAQGYASEGPRRPVPELRSPEIPQCRSLRRRRIIAPDGDASTIARLFDEFATGAYSLKALAEKARKEGKTLRGRPAYKSELHQILRKRVYTGDFDWDGETYKGSHEAIVNRDV